MCLERLKGIVVSLQVFLGYLGMHVVVTGAADPDDALPDFLAREITFVLAILVARTRDEMMLG